MVKFVDLEVTDAGLTPVNPDQVLYVRQDAQGRAFVVFGGFAGGLVELWAVGDRAAVVAALEHEPRWADKSPKTAAEVQEQAARATAYREALQTAVSESVDRRIDPPAILSPTPATFTKADLAPGGTPNAKALRAIARANRKRR